MNQVISVLIVDDCPEALDLIAGEFAAPDFSVTRAGDGAEAWLAYQQDNPDVIVSDVRMPEADGFDLLRKVRSASGVPLVLLTAYAEVSAAVSALRAGADDYLRFPDDLERLQPLVRGLVRLRGLAPGDDAERLLTGRSREMEEVRQSVRILATIDGPVFITGEKGAGRGRVAEALHALSGSSHPLVRVDKDTQDLPQGPGAVLLCDIDTFSAPEQRRWFTELQRIRGGSSPFSRILATGREGLGAPPDGAIPDARLYEELNALRIHVPALRERPDDIEALAYELTAEAARNMGIEGHRLSDGAIEALAEQPWPGNIRELKNVLEKAVAFAGGRIVSGTAIREALHAVVCQQHEGLLQRRAARHVAQRDELIDLLDLCGGNMAEMARRLGMTRGAVAYRLKKHGLA
ncbi:MAG: sigma-54-dependent Fis family transcriptional regulator [Deltaproteobacteria bacterium]|nr:sigma-54-dependent Fis family transcriptional regulator [Deltaproteobacteria bacterium]MBW2393196.1 sigma-54-dependent Fis family transcriptional regulator [Deltaproteobacteria bacterium]